MKSRRGVTRSPRAVRGAGARPGGAPKRHEHPHEPSRRRDLDGRSPDRGDLPAQARGPRRSSHRQRHRARQHERVPVPRPDPGRGRCLPRRGISGAPTASRSTGSPPASAPGSPWATRSASGSSGSGCGRSTSVAGTSRATRRSRSRRSRPRRLSRSAGTPSWAGAPRRSPPSASACRRTISSSTRR